MKNENWQLIYNKNYLRVDETKSSTECSLKKNLKNKDIILNYIIKKNHIIVLGYSTLSSTIFDFDFVLKRHSLGSKSKSEILRSALISIGFIRGNLVFPEVIVFENMVFAYGWLDFIAILLPTLYPLTFLCGPITPKKFKLLNKAT